MLCATLHVEVPVVRRFIGDYLELLDDRVERIDHDLEYGNPNSASVALLSLTASSLMLGANGVAEAADQLRRETLADDHRDPVIAERQRSLHEQATNERRRLARIWSIAG